MGQGHPVFCSTDLIHCFVWLALSASKFHALTHPHMIPRAGAPRRRVAVRGAGDNSAPAEKGVTW